MEADAEVVLNAERRDDEGRAEGGEGEAEGEHDERDEEAVMDEDEEAAGEDDEDEEEEDEEEEEEVVGEQEPEDEEVVIESLPVMRYGESGEVVAAAISRFATPASCVEVSTDAGKKEFFVHQAVLNSMAYFVAQQARWTGTGEKLKVQLPDGASLSHFVCVFDHLYHPSQRVCFDNVSYGFMVVTVATMLGCEESTVRVLKDALRSTLRTDDDLALLRTICESRDMPIELQEIVHRFTKRPKLQKDELSKKEVRMMLHNAVLLQDDDGMNYVGKHLKQQSRRGGAALREVADLIKAEGPAASQFAIDFLSAYPHFYQSFVRSWSNYGGGSDLEDRRTGFRFQESMEGQAFNTACREGLIELLDFGVQQLSQGIVGIEDIRESFRTVWQNIHKRDDFCGVPPMLGFGAALGKLEAIVQLKIVKDLQSVKLDRDENTSTIFLLDVHIVSALALEAKSVLFQSALNLPDCEFLELVKVPMLRALGEQFISELCERISTVKLSARLDLKRLIDLQVLKLIGTAGMRSLLPVASALKPAVRQRIFEKTAPKAGSDSDDGW